ncbi:hypothetical protein A4V04_00210 [Burkholderiales bacterium YL45]|uniref:Uncharacterized protein n=1 Tax=Turicimonas muris TaxID=1796652 RepID=A0A227KQJ2_9BURK|nr:hypothetical protein A4V04_00210 [Burkholderiales bacterium YL45]OXE50806.1 hypothetical protein ADH67_00440 [Turicimonas muris]
MFTDGNNNNRLRVTAALVLSKRIKNLRKFFLMRKCRAVLILNSERKAELTSLFSKIACESNVNTLSFLTEHSCPKLTDKESLQWL